MARQLQPMETEEEAVTTLFLLFFVVLRGFRCLVDFLGDSKRWVSGDFGFGGCGEGGVSSRVK